MSYTFRGSIALLLILLSCSSVNNDSYYLEGMDLEENIFPGESAELSAGAFSIQNNSDQPVLFNAGILTLIRNGTVEEITDYKIYTEEGLLDRSFEIPPEKTIHFTTNIDFITIEFNSRENYSLLLKGQLGNKEVSATSNIIFMFEEEE